MVCILFPPHIQYSTVQFTKQLVKSFSFFFLLQKQIFVHLLFFGGSLFKCEYFFVGSNRKTTHLWITKTFYEGNSTNIFIGQIYSLLLSFWWGASATPAASVPAPQSRKVLSEFLGTHLEHFQPDALPHAFSHLSITLILMITLHFNCRITVFQPYAVPWPAADNASLLLWQVGCSPKAT